VRTARLVTGSAQRQAALCPGSCTERIHTAASERPPTCVTGLTVQYLTVPYLTVQYIQRRRRPHLTRPPRPGRPQT
jgi:hypothetical protein